MNQEEIIEIMARVEHERWASWQSHVHNKCDVNQFGDWILPADARERWRVQINTPYRELSEEDKEKDRQEARKTLEALKEKGFEISPTPPPILH